MLYNPYIYNIYIPIEITRFFTIVVMAMFQSPPVPSSGLIVESLGILYGNPRLQEFARDALIGRHGHTWEARRKLTQPGDDEHSHGLLMAHRNRWFIY